MKKRGSGGYAFNVVKPKGLIALERSVDNKPLGVIFNKEHPLGETDGVPVSATRTLMSWHHSLSQVSGGLVVSAGRKMFSRKQMTKWMDILRSIANEIGEFMERNRK